jgi:hypothetical protein
MISSFRPNVVRVMLIIIVLLRPMIIKGAEWAFTPLASVEGFFNDNYQLTSAPHQSQWGDILLPEGSFSMENEKWNIAGKGHWAFYHLFEDTALDTEEHDLSLTTSLNITEKNQVHFSEISQVDSTSGSELNQTGYFLVWTQRYLNTVSMDYPETINDRLNFDHIYSYTKVAYGGNNLGLNNYFVHSFSTSLQDDWNERLKLISNAHFSYDQIEGISAISRDIGFSEGSKYRFSETFKGSLSAGAHWAETEISVYGVTLPTVAEGWTFDGQIEKEFESRHMSLELNRDVQVSGLGTIVQVNHGSVGYDQKISERLSFSLNADLFISEPFANSLFFPDSEYSRYLGKIIWQVSNEIDMILEYSYIKVATEGVSATPAANSAFVLATWHPFKNSISR